MSNRLTGNITESKLEESESTKRTSETTASQPTAQSSESTKRTSETTASQPTAQSSESMKSTPTTGDLNRKQTKKIRYHVGKSIVLAAEKNPEFLKNLTTDQKVGYEHYTSVMRRNKNNYKKERLLLKTQPDSAKATHIRKRNNANYANWRQKNITMVRERDRERKRISRQKKRDELAKEKRKKANKNEKPISNQKNTKIIHSSSSHSSASLAPEGAVPHAKSPPQLDVHDKNMEKGNAKDTVSSSRDKSEKGSPDLDKGTPHSVMNSSDFDSPNNMHNVLYIEVKRINVSAKNVNTTDVKQILDAAQKKQDKEFWTPYYNALARIASTENMGDNIQCFSASTVPWNPLQHKVSFNATFHMESNTQHESFISDLIETFQTSFCQVCVEWVPEEKGNIVIGLIKNLIAMADLGLLTIDKNVSEHNNSINEKNNGAILLPFRAGVMKLLISLWDVIHNKFEINYLTTTDEMQQNILWKATSNISKQLQTATSLKDIDKHTGISDEQLQELYSKKSTEWYEIKHLFQSVISKIPNRENVKFISLKVKSPQQVPFNQYLTSEENTYMFHGQDDFDRILFSTEQENTKKKVYFRAIENEGQGNCFFESILDSGLITLQDLQYFKDSKGKLPRQYTNDYFLRKDFIDQVRLKIFGRKTPKNKRVRAKGTKNRKKEEEEQKDQRFIGFVKMAKVYYDEDDLPTVEDWIEKSLCDLQKERQWGNELCMFLFQLVYKISLVVYGVNNRKGENCKEHYGENLEGLINQSTNEISYNYKEEHTKGTVYMYLHKGNYPLDNIDSFLSTGSINHFVCLKPVPENSNVDLDSLEKYGRIFQFPWNYSYQDLVLDKKKLSYSQYNFEKFRKHPVLIDLGDDFNRTNQDWKNYKKST